MCVCVCVCVCVLHIYRERERDRERESGRQWTCSFSSVWVDSNRSDTRSLLTCGTSRLVRSLLTCGTSRLVLKVKWLRTWGPTKKVPIGVYGSTCDPPKRVSLTHRWTRELEVVRGVIIALWDPGMSFNTREYQNYHPRLLSFYLSKNFLLFPSCDQNFSHLCFFHVLFWIQENTIIQMRYRWQSSSFDTGPISLSVSRRVEKLNDLLISWSIFCF